MSNKKMSAEPIEKFDPTPSPWAEPRDIRDLFSYRLAYLVRLNDRHAQTVLIEQYGITLGEWRTLATIRCLGTPSLRHLARTTQQDEGLLSRYVTGLIKRALLEKRTSAEDQRVVELSLTEKGEALHGEVMIFAWKLNQEMFTDLSAKEQTHLLLLLDKLFQKVAKF
ncbi:MarR family winged helix-turn-helix transcriptional regulator [Rhizobium sp. CSW-27]|uniref:MarR family winged helix-turn-helix transcriptional regulator n=1 Tax=Rhizobium sp. CSW-27 TaxID=2839985 RepID=UPI001C0335F4|nr:MarR family winged helix-turn-helix transcriptional regulator [Rhizobium sp. CSW-27]MBT9370017.1 MarR family winged helix-turn-helix transcriptional regulator [Rhizobium sp. CSW-27]